MPETRQTNLPEIRMIQAVARNILTLWREELDRTNARTVEDGHVILDTTPCPPPRQRVRGQHTEHQMDGSTGIFWYIAGREATARAIREAAESTEMMHLPRHLYIGKIIDILRNRDGQAYLVCRSITRREEGSGRPAYRAFNPFLGSFVEAIINPLEATMTAEMSRNRTADTPPAQVPGAAEAIQRAIEEPPVGRRNIRGRSRR